MQRGEKQWIYNKRIQENYGAKQLKIFPNKTVGCFHCVCVCVFFMLVVSLFAQWFFYLCGTINVLVSKRNSTTTGKKTSTYQQRAITAAAAVTIHPGFDYTACHKNRNFHWWIQTQPNDSLHGSEWQDISNANTYFHHIIENKNKKKK